MNKSKNMLSKVSWEFRYILKPNETTVSTVYGNIHMTEK